MRNTVRITLSGRGWAWHAFLRCFGIPKPHPHRVLALGEKVGKGRNTLRIIGVKVLEEGPTRATVLEYPSGSSAYPYPPQVGVRLPTGFHRACPWYGPRRAFALAWNEVRNRPKKTHRTYTGLLEF